MSPPSPILTTMPTWDTYEDLKKTLDQFALDNPETSFVLVMVQSNGKKARSKGHGTLVDAASVESAGLALEAMMGFAASVYDMELADEDDEEDEPEGFLPPPNDLPD